MFPFITAQSFNPCTRTTDTEAMASRGYRLGNEIGKGSFSTVITSTFSDNAGHTVRLACKVTDLSKTGSKFMNRFLRRELEILTKLNHANIIELHSILQHGPKIFVFMRFAENGDLSMHIAKSGPVKELQAKAWFLQMANALQYIHSCGIAHRDMKCENMLISKNYNIKLADFGFACYCRDGCGRELKCKTHCGSEAYIAPEVMACRQYDAKLGDAWALGVILFVMLNAKFPFEKRNAMELFIQKLNKDYKFDENLQHCISDNAKATVALLLEPDANARWNISEVLICSWLRNAMA